MSLMMQNWTRAIADHLGCSLEKGTPGLRLSHAGYTGEKIRLCIYTPIVHVQEECIEHV